MNGRHVLSVVVVLVGAVLFMADRVIGDGPFSFPLRARLAVAPTFATSATATRAPAAALTTSPEAGHIPIATNTVSAPPAASHPASVSPTPTMNSSSPTVAPKAPDQSELRAREGRALVSSRIEGVAADEVWSDLLGFSGKSNQERERYVSDVLFPKAGLIDIRKEIVPYGGPWGSEHGNWDGLSNVIALRRGSLPSGSRKLIILGAHFDKVTYPGRSRNSGASDGILDNASGVTAIAKIIQSIRAPFNDIEVVAFASEEPDPYFNGSRIYFGKLPSEGRVQFFANFDCLGRGNLALIRGAAEPSLSGLALDVANNQAIPLVWRPASPESVSDHVIAQYFGIKVLSFTSDSYDWHNTHVPEDNVSAVDRESYYRQYLLSLRIVAYLDAYLAETVVPKP